jgi:carboxymethylenebutenolidase
MRRHARGIAPGLLALGLTLAAAPAPPEPPEGTLAPAQAPSPAPAAPEIDEVSETFPSHGKKVAVDRFTPTAPGRYPLVVVLHGHGGIAPEGRGSSLHEEARRLARQGYVALVPHYFDRTGTKFNNAVRNGRYYKVWRETIADAVTYGGKLPQVDRRRVGLIGHSLGASVVVSCGMVDRRISAVVEYAGGLVFIDGPPVQPVPMPPTLILHGDADTVVSIREARKLEAVFTEWQSPFEIQIYPGAGHGLRGEDQQDAWKRTLGFLGRYLKSP